MQCHKKSKMCIKKHFEHFVKNDSQLQTQQILAQKL